MKRCEGCPCDRYLSPKCEVVSKPLNMTGETVKVSTGFDTWACRFGLIGTIINPHVEGHFVMIEVDGIRHFVPLTHLSHFEHQPCGFEQASDER